VGEQGQGDPGAGAGGDAGCRGDLDLAGDGLVSVARGVGVSRGIGRDGDGHGDEHVGVGVGALVRTLLPGHFAELGGMGGLVVMVPTKMGACGTPSA